MSQQNFATAEMNSHQSKIDNLLKVNFDPQTLGKRVSFQFYSICVIMENMTSKMTLSPYRKSTGKDQQ